MYLDLRAYILASKYQANFTSYCIYSEHTFCVKYITFKVHGSIFSEHALIRYLLRMVRFKKDVIPWCLAHQSKCVIYLTVGDHCRVFPLHRMYEHRYCCHNLVLDIRLDGLCLVMHECSY